ncbi:caspase domain-containing protein, partial [Lyophyllum atratum]
MMADLYEPKSPISPTSPSSSIFDDSLPKIFALIIGINTYASQEFGDLTAAVGDADKFEDFLRDKLNVPDENITNLREGEATRAKIIEAFVALRDNPRIIKDQAAIVIYFAGHGACVPKPSGWADWITASGEIEVMCPTDMGVQASDKEEPVPGIPDRTISVLLNHISELKGNNITLILDCCSSGGLNRTQHKGTGERDISNDPIAQGYVPRQLFNAPSIPPNCDEKILSKDSTRGAAVAQGFSGKHHASHVLLAACGRQQVAYEDPRTNSGIFTSGLLRTLSALNVNDLTYTNLMHRLAMPRWQTPHCEGQHVNRRLFNKRALGADGSFILGQLEKKEDGSTRYVLHAGAAQGVTEGSTFGIHASNLISDAKHSNPSLGMFVASEIGAFKSEIDLPPTTAAFPVPRLFYCKLIRRGTEGIKIFCEDKEWLETVFPAHLRDALSVVFADNPAASSLQLTLLDDKVHFTRNDPMVTPWIGSNIPHTVEKLNHDRIREIVRRAVHFNHQLTRTAPDDFKNVWMELRVLESRYSVDHGSTLTPIGPNLIDNEPAGVVVDEDARLGMAIHNRTDLPLYPYLFYFDPSDLVIIEWYTPPFGAGQGRLTTEVDAPLPPRGYLSIGYGDGGFSPWQFLLREGEDVDVGFFKLFLSTSPADFSSIPQESPFEENVSRLGRLKAAQLPDAERWGAMLSTVVQVRYERQLPLKDVGGLGT